MSSNCNSHADSFASRYTFQTNSLQFAPFTYSGAKTENVHTLLFCIILPYNKWCTHYVTFEVDIILIPRAKGQWFSSFFWHLHRELSECVDRDAHATSKTKV
jgi:hypothetical protein